MSCRHRYITPRPSIGRRCITHRPRVIEPRIITARHEDIGHPAIAPPFTIMVATGEATGRVKRIASAGRRQTLQPAQIRTQHLRHHHAAIGLLVIFQHGHQGAAHRQA